MAMPIMMRASTRTATARAVKSLPQCRCAWPATPSSAAEMLPMVTDMFIQCRKVRSLAAGAAGGQARGRAWAAAATGGAHAPPSLHRPTRCSRPVHVGGARSAHPPPRRRTRPPTTTTAPKKALASVRRSAAAAPDMLAAAALLLLLGRGGGGGSEMRGGAARGRIGCRAAGFAVAALTAVWGSAGERGCSAGEGAGDANWKREGGRASTGVLELALRARDPCLAPPSLTNIGVRPVERRARGSGTYRHPLVPPGGTPAPPRCSAPCRRAAAHQRVLHNPWLEAAGGAEAASRRLVLPVAAERAR